jgi:hypothetical protein
MKRRFFIFRTLATMFSLGLPWGKARAFVKAESRLGIIYFEKGVGMVLAASVGTEKFKTWKLPANSNCLRVAGAIAKRFRIRLVPEKKVENFPVIQIDQAPSNRHEFLPGYRWREVSKGECETWLAPAENHLWNVIKNRDIIREPDYDFLTGLRAVRAEYKKQHSSK